MSSIPENFVLFFSAELLALYANQPDRYSVQTDYFSGEIETSAGHFDEARAAGQHLIRVRFGFRTMRSGDLALAVLAPDLKDASPDEKAKWLGFGIDKDALSLDADLRFEMWVDRYIHGSWEVENGVISQIKQEVYDLNALTDGAVGVALFGDAEMATLSFPTAQNNHRYHDAHSEAYKFLIDGLSKEALKRLAGKLGIALKAPDSARTLKLLEQLLPEDVAKTVQNAFDVISKNRRLADHQKRPQAEAMPAFEVFDADLRRVVTAMQLLKSTLSARLGISVSSARARFESLTSPFYPKFDDQLGIEPHYSICTFSEIVGKTIERVEYGWRRRHNDLHDSEMAILRFTDGSHITICAASNIGNLTSSHEGLEPRDLRVSFFLTYVPELSAADAG
jgi:hypothetical protein